MNGEGRAALNLHYVAHAKGYLNGPPQAKRPPMSVAINPGNGVAAAIIIEHPPGG